MRRRWEFDPVPFIALWLIGGFVVTVVVAATTNPCDSTHQCGMDSDLMSTATRIAFGVWLGPFVLVPCGGIVGFVLWCCWDARPRRVTEPVSEDLRTRPR